MNYKLIGAGLLICFISSCEDERVMVLPPQSDFVGTWECRELSDSTRSKLGVNVVLSRLILEKNGTYHASGFPERDPLRLIDIRGHWNLVAASITPSGVCSVNLQEIGTFLSIRRRSGKFILHYPISPAEGYIAKYFKE